MASRNLEHDLSDRILNPSLKHSGSLLCDVYQKKISSNSVGTSCEYATRPACRRNTFLKKWTSVLDIYRALKVAADGHLSLS